LAQLERAGRIDELVKQLEVRARAAPPQEALGHLLRAAELARTRLRDAARAEALLWRGAALGPAGRAALEALAASFEQKQDGRGLVEVLERLGALSEGEEAATFLCRAADLYERKLARRDRAVLCLQRAQRLTKEPAVLARRIRELLAREGRLRAVYESLERERRERPHVELGPEYLALAESILDDPAEHGLAKEALAGARALGAEGVELQEQVLADLPQSWRERAKTLRAKSLEERDRHTAARQSLAVAKLHAGFEPASAAKIREAVERALLLWPAMPDALEFLEREAEKAGDFDVVAAGYERLASGYRDKNQGAELLLRAGILRLTRLTDPAGARVLFERSVAADPSRPDSATLLAEQYLGEQRAAEAATVLERHLATVQDRAQQLSMRLRLAELCEGALGDAPRARIHLEAALRLEPAHGAAALRLLRLLTRQGVVEGMESLSEIALWAERPIAERVAAFEGASLALDREGLPEPAYRVLARAFALAPERADLLEALTLQAKKAHAEADLGRSLWRAAQRLAEGPERLGLYRRAAELLEDGHPSEARVAWEAVLARAPQDGRARAAVAKAQGAPAAPAVPGAPPGLLQRSIPVLHRSIPVLHPVTRPAEQGDWGKVAQLKARLDTTQDPAQSRTLLLELKGIYEHRLADPRAAFDAGLRALALAADDAPLRAELAGLAKDLSAHPQLTAAFLGLAQRASPSLGLALCLEAAQAAEAGGALEEATQALFHALQLAPGDSATFKRLAAVLEKGGWYEELELSLRRRLDLAHIEGPERKELLLALVNVSQRLGRLSEAADALKEAVGLGADEREALPRLAELYERSGRTSDLARVLGRQLALAQGAKDETQVAALSLRRAQVLDAALGDRSEAVRHYAQILLTTPTHPEAVHALEKLLEDPAHKVEAARSLLPAYEALREPRKLLAALETVAEHTDDLLERVLLLKQAAQIHQTLLHQPELAFETLAKALRLVPRDQSVRAAAAQAAEEADALDAYAELLAQAAAEEEGDGKVSLLAELAEVREKKLGNPQGAVDALVAVVAVRPAHVPALQALRRLHRAAETWPELALVLERLVALTEAPLEKSALYRELGALLEERLREPERAADVFRAQLVVDGRAVDAVTALDRLYTALDRPGDLAWALAQRRALEPEGPGARELLLREAVVRRERLEDPEGSLALFADILRQDPSHTAARAQLDDWASEKGAWGAQAFTVLDAALEQGKASAQRVELRKARLEAAGDDERPRLVRELMELYEKALDQPEGAFQTALAAFVKGVDREGVRPELPRLAERAGGLPALASAHEEVADALEQAGGDPAAELRRAAELRAELGQGEAAVRLWQRLLAKRPEDPQALDRLGALHAQAKNAKELSLVYAKQAELEKDPQARRGLLLKSAEAHQAAGQDGEAVAALEAALALGEAPDALLALDRLHEAAARPHEQAQALGRLFALAQGEEKVAFGRRLATLLEAVDPPRSAEVLGELLEVLPGDPASLQGLTRLLPVATARARAAELLEPALRRLGDKGGLCEVLEVRRASVPPEALGALLDERAGLLEELDQPKAAFAVRLEAFRANPAGPRDRLEHLAALTGALEELCAAYEEVGKAPPSEALGLALWQRLAFFYSGPLARHDRTVAALEAWALLQPNEPVVFGRLVDVHRKAGAFREQAQAMKRLVRAEPNPERQVGLLFELAKLAEETLSDKGFAAQCYGEVLRRKPEDEGARKELGRVLTQSERWPELATLLAREIELAESRQHVDEALSLMVRLGRLRFSRLSDARGALDVLSSVLTRKPGHEGAVGALEEMAHSESPLRGEAAATLEPVFAAGGDHLKQVEMLEAKVSTEQAPQARAALLRQVAQLYAGPIKNPELAFLAASRALRELPEPESLKLCINLAPSANASDELAATLEDVATRATDVTARAEIFRALAKQLEQLDQKPKAIEAWKQVIALSATDTEAITSIGRLLAESGRLPELLDVLRRQATTLEDPEARAAVLLRMGVLQDDQLKDLTGALATFRRLLELQPGHPHALERMESLCQRQERWPELADVLTKRLALLGDKADLDLKFKLGAVREAKLSDRFGAVELYAEVLAKQPKHSGALERLNAILQQEPQNAEAARVLMAAHRQAREHKLLANLLEQRAGISPDAEERKQLLMELATLRDAEGEPELTFLALFKAFKEDPNDAALRQRMEKAAEDAKSYDELGAAYEEALPRIAEAADAASVCLKLGQLFEKHVGEPEKAVVAYEKARSLDPAVAPRALAALELLYTQAEQWAELVQCLDELAKLAADPAQKAALLFRLGQVAQEKLQASERAGEAFEQVIDLDKSHLAAARALEQLYEASGDHQKLYGVLKREVELAQGAERERLLAKMAKVSAEGLADVSQSIDLYKELLAKNPRNEQAFQSLEQALAQAERYDELKVLIQTRLNATLDPRELVRLNTRLGTILFTMLKKPEEAVAPFRAALDRDARNKVALESLRDIYEALEKRDELVGILRRLIPVADDADGVKKLRIKLAETLAQMGRREEALDAARRALEVEPHGVEDLARVQQIFLSLKALNDAVRAMELRAEVLTRMEEREQAIATYFEIAEVWKGVANKPESAALVLEKVLEQDPSNPQAYAEVLKLYSQSNDWRGYATALDRHLPHVVTDEEKISALRELGRIREQKLGQKDVAFLSLCRALELSPEDDALREDVERLADETESHEELAAVYETVADGLPRGPLAERMYRVLARIQDQKLDDPSSAEASLRKILEFDPANQAALEGLADMFERRGNSRELVIALEQKLETAETLEARKGVLRQIARVYEEKLKDPDEAAQALVRALELEPDVQTLAELSELYRRQHRWGDLANTLLRARDLAGTNEERSRLQLEVGTVHEKEMGDDEVAVEDYRTALEYDPTNREALEALERLYTKLDRPAELLAVFEARLNLTEDYRERVTLLFRSAAIWEDKFHNAANADACVDGVLALDPANLQAIKTLERLRREQGRWEELVTTLGRHIQLTGDPKDQAQLYVELGEVYRGQLKQSDLAAEAFNAALQVDPECEGAMNALGTVYEKSGNWPFALEMLQKEVQSKGETPEAVELHHRMGKINEQMLMDYPTAKACYQEALRIDPGHLPSLRALKGLYEQESDWAAYEKVLTQEAEKADDVDAKSQALLELGRYYADRKEDPEAARIAFEDAVRLTPNSAEAARPLVDLYTPRENWEGAEKMLQVVIRQLRQTAAEQPGGDADRDLCRQLYRLGYVQEKQGKRDRALEAYEEAYQLDATYLPALEGLGNLLVQTQRFEEALKVYQSILIHHREDLTDLEVVELYWQIGEVYNGLRQPDRAQNHFDKALSIDPGHEPSLRAQVVLADAAGKYDKSAEFRQRLVESQEGEDKLKTYLELAQLAREKLNDAHLAIDAYAGALKVSPRQLQVMDALYMLYRQTSQPQKAVEVLERMLTEEELKSDAQRAKRVWFALGELVRDSLKDSVRATEAFNAALDHDPRFVEAFSALEAMLGGEKQWKVLEENYARMIQRLPKTDDTHAARMALWRALGDLYLQVLKQPEGALTAYQVVAAGLPQDAAVQETFAELAAQVPGQEEKAVAAYRTALETTKDPGKVVSALATLAAKRKDYDLAYLSAQVATHLLGSSGAGEKEILTKLTPYAKKREQVQRALSDRQWHESLFHPRNRGPLSELLAVLFEQVGHLYSVPFAQLQVNPKRHRIDPATAQEYQIHHYRAVAKALGMQAVELYSPYLVAARERMGKKTAEPAPEPMLGVEICHTHPVCLKVGGKFFGEPGQKEAYAMLGRAMAYLRPELALTKRLGTERLRAVIQAAVATAGLPFAYTVPAHVLDAERQALAQALPEPARAALHRAAQAYTRVATPRDVEDFLEAAELSSVRTALFVTGELEPLKKVLQGEPTSGQRLSLAARLKEVQNFALSEDLAVLRRAVGINVEVAAAGPKR
jgi:tetratricopeptide (TPR) repeat protein